MRRRSTLHFTLLAACIIVAANCETVKLTNNVVGTGASGGTPATPSGGGGVIITIPTPRLPAKLNCVDYQVAGLGVVDGAVMAAMMDSAAAAVLQTTGQTLLSKSNEPHDCQKLIHRNKNTGVATYEQLWTLWAVDSLNLNGFPKRTTVGVFVESRAWQHPDDDDAAKYTKLKCVQIQGKPAVGMKAWLMEPGPTGCADGKLVDTLQVQRISQPSGGGNHARGMRIIDTGGARYMIALQCGTRWCVLYKKDETFVTEAQVGQLDADGDRQRLAIPAASGHIVPSDLVGTLRPANPNLNRQDKTIYDQWVTMATVTFSGGSSAEINAYATRLQLTPADLAYPVEVQLHWLSTDTYEMRYNSTNPATAAAGATAGAPIPVHWMKISATSMPALGFTRWRWLDSDESTWVQCYQGCCTGA